MSFILDALKKSETDRQQQAGAEFSNVPSSSGSPQSLKWLWILALLLGVNVAVLLGVLMRPDAPDPEQEAIESAPAEALAAAEPSFEEQVARARELHVEREQEVATRPQAQTTPQVQSAAPPRQPAARVKTIDELRLDGSLLIADLHLDIHVYDENPDERFVFVNMAKLREGSQLDEGPVVDEITPDGVILAYQGITFLLPRE